MFKSESNLNQVSFTQYFFDWSDTKSRANFSLIVLCIVYIVGILGIVINIDQRFIYLTPVNLLFSLLVVLLNHRNWQFKHVLFMLLCLCVGFFSEVIGVNTGLIFGEYSYGPVLGIKVWETPLIIGVNWLLLVYASNTLINHILPSLNTILKSILAAALMVILDIFIEPVAISMEFWDWEADFIPLQNYLAWFGIAFLLGLCFHFLVKDNRNIVAIGLFILQFLFFIILGITEVV